MLRDAELGPEHAVRAREPDLAIAVRSGHGQGDAFRRHDPTLVGLRPTPPGCASPGEVHGDADAAACVQRHAVTAGRARDRPRSRHGDARLGASLETGNRRCVTRFAGMTTVGSPSRTSLGCDIREVRMPLAEHDRHEVDRDLVDESGGERLPRDGAGGDADRLVTGDLLRARDRGLDAVRDEVGVAGRRRTPSPSAPRGSARRTARPSDARPSSRR